MTVASLPCYSACTSPIALSYVLTVMDFAFHVCPLFADFRRLVSCCTYRNQLNCTGLFYTILYCTVLYFIVLYSNVLYCTVLCYTVMCGTALNSFVLNCTVQYCIVPYCTVLHCTVFMLLRYLSWLWLSGGSQGDWMYVHASCLPQWDHYH